MPEVQEVFRMVTEKAKLDPGALDRQHTRQRRRSMGKRLGAYAVAAAIGLAAVVLILVTRAGENSTTPCDEPPTVAPVPISGPFFVDLRTGERTPLAESLAGSNSYAASPDGTRLAYGTTRGGGCGEADVTTVANIDGTDARTLESPEGRAICGARWSPDGTKLVYQEQDGTSDDDVGNLFVQDLSSGRRTQLSDLELSRAWWWFLSPSFSPGGHKVLFHLPRSSLQTTKFDVWSVPVTGGEPTLVLRNAAFPMLNPLPGPEGWGIQFVSPWPSDSRVEAS
jgi:Tol biopolymer transport system component